MTKNTNRQYVVEGNLAAEKSSEAHPTKVLCDECAANYTILTNEGPSSEDCEDCGGPEDDE
jgi:hypothetical protein